MVNIDDFYLIETQGFFFVTVRFKVLTFSFPPLSIINLN